MNIFKIYGNSPLAWQRLAFKLGTLTMAPDTMILALTSSNAMSGVMTPNSYIVYDDISFGTSAPIPNGDLESWYISTSIETPSEWSCESATTFSLNGYGIPIHKTTDKYDGNYALEMKTMAGDNNMHFCGINDGNWNNNLQQYEGGFPYTNAIDTLVGWYKYTPKAGGTAGVNIQFKKSGLYGYSFTILSATSTWTKFEIPFHLVQAPDSAIITVNSSNTPFNIADTGSVLIVDAIQFKSTIITNIQPFSAGSSVLIAPNPTKGEFSILYIPKNAGNVSFTLYDETGKVVKNAQLNSIKTTLNISDYPKGVYILKINDGRNELNKKLILQ